MKLMIALLAVLFSSPVWADAAAPAQQGGIMSLLPMIIIFMVVFYFLLIRPQSKRAKEQRSLLSKIAKGDEVVTSGGLVGTLAKVTDDFVVLTIAPGVDITLQKGAVTTALPKGTIKNI